MVCFACKNELQKHEFESPFIYNGAQKVYHPVSHRLCLMCCDCYKEILEELLEDEIDRFENFEIKKDLR